MADGLVLTDLVKTFKGPNGPVRAVRGIDLTIAAGQTVALLGPNGAGKSTTIDMILGLREPDSGEVRIFGKPPALAVADGDVGGMLQTGNLIPELTVRELVTMTASLYPNPLAVDDVLHRCHVDDIADRRGSKLSGGQTQRVRFAVALVSNPQLLLLDEPTVALDVESRRDFWNVMRNFASLGKTIVFATHYLDEADDYADRVVLMANGQIVADGSTTEIKAMVGSRVIRATLPTGTPDALAKLAGVASAERHGDTVVLRCTDSDAAIRALLQKHPSVADIEITGAGLEEAFVQLTADEAEVPA